MEFDGAAGKAVAQHQQRQIAVAAPESAHAGHAVAFAVEVTAQPTDPQHRLPNRRNFDFGRQLLLVGVDPQGFPGILAAIRALKFIKQEKRPTAY